MMRPYTTVVLAMSADGKITDILQSPARFGSADDRLHLETQIAAADGVLFGAQTLRAYGSTLRITESALLQQRQQQGLSPQPIHIVCSRSAQFDPGYRFFQQPISRWLITTLTGAQRWQDQPQFDQILTPTLTSTLTSTTATIASKVDEPQTIEFDWHATFEQLVDLGVKRLVVSGGGQLIASLLALDLIDELWLTVCPLLLGGVNAPTPVEGRGFSAELAPQLELLSAQTVAQEVFLHYKVQRKKN